MRDGVSPLLVDHLDAGVDVAGKSLPIESVTVSRSLNGLPGTQRGFVSASAEISVSPKDVSGARSVPNGWFPVDGWPPTVGDRTVVSVGGRQFLRGHVEEVSGSASGVTVSAIDRYESFDRAVTIPPLANKFPPEQENGLIRYPFLSTHHIVDRVFRSCGWYTTPPRIDVRGLSVPMCGALWPETGTLVTGSSAGNPDLFPTFVHSESGWQVSDCAAEFRLADTALLKPSVGVKVGFVADMGKSGSAKISFSAGGAVIEVAITQGRVAVGTAVTPEQIVLVVPPEGMTRVVVSFSGATVTVSSSTAGSVTGTLSMSAPNMDNWVRSVKLTAINFGISGLQMWQSSIAENYLTYRLNAHIEGDTGIHPRIVASPAIEARQARSLLDEIAESTSSCWWIDEDDVARWVAADTIMRREPVTRLTATDSLLDLAWSAERFAAASRVTLRSRTPAIAIGRESSIFLGQGSGGSATSGLSEEFISAGADEDWLHVQAPATRLTQASFPAFNRGVGSFTGVTDAASQSLVPSNVAATSAHQIGANTVKSSVDSVSASDLMLTVPEESGIRQSWWGGRLPIIRGRGKISWADLETVSTVTGPVGLPEVTLDAGPWVQAEQSLDQFVAWYAGVVTVNTPRRVDIPIVPDFRLQLGDVVTVVDDVGSGIELSGVIAGVRLSVDSRGEEMHLRLYVTRVRSTFALYGLLDADVGGDSYGSLDARVAGSVYGNVIEGILNGSV